MAVNMWLPRWLDREKNTEKYNTTRNGRNSEAITVTATYNGDVRGQHEREEVDERDEVDEGLT